MSNPEALFFHQRDPNLHHSPEVEHVTSYLRQAEHIPNEPTAKIEAYLGALASPDLVNDGVITGDQTSIDRQIELAIVGPNDISQSFFDLQLHIMREEMGFDGFRITPEVRRGYIEMVQEDQRACLQEWATYLTSKDAAYPDWFKLYTFSSVIKLKEYDAEKEHFRRRSNGTAANFPELNQEALAGVFDAINSTHSIDPTRESAESDELLGQLSKTANFGKMYSRAFNLAKPSREERFETTEGQWVKYDRTDDPEVITELSRSLVGHGTTWCTANIGTAKIQLAQGDFYTYYSYDKEGNATIPRLAIRMENGHVAEVRGIEPGQNVEECMMDIATEKLADLPGGEFYQRVAEDMKKVKAIHESVESGRALDIHDIFFLREYGGKIHRFGYRRDRRVDRLLLGRDENDDFNLMIDTFGHESFANMLIDAGQASLLLARLTMFEEGAVDQKSLADGLISSSEFELLLKNFQQFGEGVIDTKKLASAILATDRGGYSNWVNARLIGEYFKCFKPTDFSLRGLGHGMMDAHQYDNIMKNFDVLGDHVDKVALARGLSRGSSHLAAQNIDKFGLDKDQCLEIALEIAGRKSGYHLATHFKKFAEIIGEEDLANALLAKGYTEVVAKAARKFKTQVVDHYDLVATMFETGKLTEIADNLNRFDPEVVDHDNLYQKLLEARNFDAITRNLSKFHAGVIDVEAYYKDLVDRGYARLLCSHLDQFDPETVDMRALIQNVAENLHGQALFRDFDAVVTHYSQKELAELLIATGNVMVLNVNRYRFDKGSIDFDQLAHALIKSGRADVVVKNFEVYQSEGMTATYLVTSLMQAGQTPVISRQFKVFAANMDHSELAATLMEGADPDSLKVVITNLDKFDDNVVDTERLAREIVAQGDVKLISRNISKVLARMDNGRLAQILCAGGGANVVFTHRDKFTDGSVTESELIRGLIAEGKSKLVTLHFGIEAVEEAKQPQTIMELIGSGAGRLALKQLIDKPGDGEIDLPAAVGELVERGEAQIVVTTLKKLPTDLNLQRKVVDALVNDGKIGVIITHLKKFSPEAINTKKLATGLFAQDDEEMIERSFDIFMRNMKPLDFMTELVRWGHAHMIEDNIEKLLASLDHNALATFLMDVGLGDVAERHKDKFENLEFSENI